MALLKWPGLLQRSCCRTKDSQCACDTRTVNNEDAEHASLKECTNWTHFMKDVKIMHALIQIKKYPKTFCFKDTKFVPEMCVVLT